MLLLLADWLGYAIPLVAFIALVIGGYKLGMWIFKKFLSDMFHDGEKRWGKPKQ